MLRATHVVRVLLGVGPRRRRLQRRHQRLRAQPRPRPRLRGTPRRLAGAAAQPARQAARQLRRQAAGRRGTAGSRSAGLGTYRGALEVVPDRLRRRLAERVNAVPRQPVREGRDPERVARLLAAGGAAGPGGRLAAPSRSPPASTATASTSTTTPAARSTTGSTARPRPPTEPAEATRGQVVTYGGKIAETFFSACSGGHTESIQNVFFGSPIPYLVGVPDPYDYYCPLHKWTLRFRGPEISSRLGAYLDGRLKRIVVTKRGDLAADHLGAALRDRRRRR